MKIPKGPFWAKICLISFFLNFGTQEGSPIRPPIGSLFSHGENRRHGFFQLILSRLVVPGRQPRNASHHLESVKHRKLQHASDVSACCVVSLFVVAKLATNPLSTIRVKPPYGGGSGVSIVGRRCLGRQVLAGRAKRPSTTQNDSKTLLFLRF